MKNSLQEAQKEYQEKVAIKNRLAAYYRAQRTKNGLSDMAKIKAYMPDALMFRHLKRDMVIAHLDFEPILELIANKQEFVVVSGLNPSSALHLGHTMLFGLLFSLQRLGGRIYIPLTNDESYIDGKVATMGESRRLAYEEIIPSIIAFGFDPKRTHIYVDTEYPTLYPFAMRVSKYVSMREVESLFGKEALTNPGQIFYRGCEQLAEILMPQLPEFGGPKHTLIPVGIDQHPYILLARDVAKRMKMVPPSEFVMRFLPSLKNPEEKMSGSKPETAIYLSDTQETIRKKISSAYTGAVSSLEGHQKFGGVPEACSVFALLNAYRENDNELGELYRRYTKGELLAKELKAIAIDCISSVVRDHQKKKAELEIKNEDYLLTQPIQSYIN